MTRIRAVTVEQLKIQNRKAQVVVLFAASVVILGSAAGKQHIQRNAEFGKESIRLNTKQELLFGHVITLRSATLGSENGRKIILKNSVT